MIQNTGSSKKLIFLGGHLRGGGHTYLYHPPGSCLKPKSDQKSYMYFVCLCACVCSGQGAKVGWKLGNHLIPCIKFFRKLIKKRVGVGSA